MKFFQNFRSMENQADPYADRVNAQAVDFLYRNLARVAASTTLMPIAMVLVMWGRIDHTLLLAWSGAIITVTLVRVYLSRLYLRLIPEKVDAGRWGNFYGMTSLVNGFLWGAAAMLFFVPDSTVHQVFLFTCIVGLATGSLILNAYWIAGYYLLTFPALSAASLRLLMEGGGGNIALAAILIMFLVIVSQLALSTRYSVLAAIRLRFENLELVERLREEKEKAEAASHDKTRFLASASHDLRQPVHALTLFVDALEAEVRSQKGKDLLVNVDRSIDVLNQLLGSLLDISKLDANIVKPNFEHFPLQSLFDSLHKEYAILIKEKGLDFHLDIQDQLLVVSDRILLGTIMRNLIGNAIRYTHTGSITIHSAQQEGKVRISVCDTGIGIPADQQREIFREFYQLTNPERDRSKGLGLGLAIIDRLTTLLGHKIELQSEVGKGSCFSVILPAGDPDRIVLMQNQHAHSGHFDIIGMRVLVIDDEQAVRDGMEAVLDNWGCIAILAGSEEEALAKLKGTDLPHVIIADYRLRDGKNGAQAIEKIRTACGKEIPALIITGDTGPDRLREAEASGHTLMHKPVQTARLRTYLRHVKRRKV